MNRWISLAGMLGVLFLTGLHCRKSGAGPSPEAPSFSLILRITPQGTRLWLWDTLGTPITTAQVHLGNLEIPYVSDSGFYFRARGFFEDRVLLEIQGLQETPWLRELSPPPFRSITLLTPSSGEVHPRAADLEVYWLLDAEPTRGIHQVVARYLTDSTVVYRSDSLPAAQTFWAIPGTALTREGRVEIQVFSGAYQALEGLADPPPHPEIPRALDFGGSYAAFVLRDTVTVSIGYPGTGVEVWRGLLEGRGTGTWNRVDSVFQTLITWNDTTEFFQGILPWPPESTWLPGSTGDTLRLVADSLDTDSVSGWFRLWGTRSDSGRWWGVRIP